MMKIVFIINLLLLYVSFLFPQEQDSLSSVITMDSIRADFVKYELNIIGNPEKGLSHFYECLYRARNEDSNRVVIYHFGDSHVRAAYFAKEIAQNLQELFGSAGGYMFYPAEKKKVYVKKKKRKVRVRVKTPATVKQFSEAGESGIGYYIYGISGKTFNYFTEFDILYKHIEEYNPDLIIITLGTNDAFAPRFDNEESQAHINSLITKIRKFDPKVSILLTIPPDSFIKKKYANPNISEIRKTIINYCTMSDLAYWDLFSIMGGDNSMQEWFENDLAGKDKVHFTEKGYRLQGELFYKALMNGYEQFTNRPR